MPIRAMLIPAVYALAMERQHIASGSPWEEQVGYSRAVRVGNAIHVTGTIGTDASGALLSPNDAYQQSMDAFDIIERALQEAGAAFEHIIRTRIYITSLDHAEDVGRAHRERLGHVRPCCTMVAVHALFADALVEIEVDAVLG